MEKRQVTFAFGRIAFDKLRAAFESGQWISWPLPDHVFRFELDPTIEDDSVIHRHDGRRLETQRLMQHTFPHTYLPDDITHLLNHGDNYKGTGQL